MQYYVAHNQSAIKKTISKAIKDLEKRIVKYVYVHRQ